MLAEIASEHNKLKTTTTTKNSPHSPVVLLMELVVEDIVNLIKNTYQSL